MVSPATIARRPKNNWFPWLAGLTVLFVGGLGFILIVVALAGSSMGNIGVIELSGAITDEGARGILGGGSAGGARGFIEDVEKARRDPNIKAVVIRVNSPGGSAAASQEMYQAVRRLHDAKKPVICSMGDVAASGGYYVAAACDKIYANGSTLTGSIGVISQFLNYGSLFRKLGLDEATIKSGRFKDAGSPTRPLTAAERQLFQTMIGDVYQQFVADVVAGRKEPTKGQLTKAKLLTLADGRVFTGRQAKNVGLVDENGGLYEAIQEAAKRAGVLQPITRNLSSGGGLGSLFGSSSAVGGLDSFAQGLGAAFARGAVGQIKSDAQGASLPMVR
jgi:protease IV